MRLLASGRGHPPGRPLKMSTKRSRLPSLARAILGVYSGSLYLPSDVTCFQDSAGTIAGAKDAVVGKLLDSIGTNHAIQSTAGYKPILRKGTVTGGVSDGVGPWWLDFDGVDDRLELSSVPFLVADSSFASVSNKLRVGGALTVFSVSNTGVNNPLAVLDYTAVAGGYGPRAFWRNDAGSVLQFPADTVNRVGSALVCTAKKAGDDKALRVNAAQVATASGALGTTTVNVATIGALRRLTTGNFFNGEFYGLAVGTGAITDVQLATIERYLASLAQVQL